MDRFPVYIVDSKVFGDPTPDKTRPAIFFNWKDGKIWLLGVYSERDRFSRYPEQYYKIEDKSVVPLTGEADSFVWIGKVVRITMDDFRKIKTKDLNELSFNDSSNLTSRFNAYYSE